MSHPDTTHRLHGEGALCGEQAPRTGSPCDSGSTLSPCDSAVTCPTCLALIALAERRRRELVRRSVIVIGKMGLA
jgi:hypothetical protein